MAHDVDLQEPEKNQESTPPTPSAKRSRTRHYNVLPEPGDAVFGERAIWIAVITQAMMDAISKSTTIESRYYKFEAIHWLTGNSQNFIMVCLLADFDPDYIRRLAKRAMVSPRAWRMAPGKGKRYEERRKYRIRKGRPQT